MLFTDIRMPGDVDGWELGRRARALLTDIRVIYATGYGDDGTPLADHERKITKPYRYEEILRTLKQLELL